MPRVGKFRFDPGSLVFVIGIAFLLGLLTGVTLHKLLAPGPSGPLAGPTPTQTPEFFEVTPTPQAAEVTPTPTQSQTPTPRATEPSPTPAQTPQEPGATPTQPENLQRASVKIVAVTSEGSGMMSDLTAELGPGEGRIWVDTHTLVGFDFQYADRIAVEVAARLTGLQLDDDGVGIKGIDVRFMISTPTGESVQIQAIDGPSAGAAATLAVIAAIENRQLRTDAVITGTIKEDGSIGVIGGLYVVKDRNGELHVMGKPQAAYESGMKLLLVPSGQPVEYYEPRGFWWISSYRPISFLREVLEQLGWDLEVREVSNISEAEELMLF